MAEANADDIPEDVKQAYETGGIEKVQQYLTANEDNWKTVKINVGVIGLSGVGKSTFINVYRGIEDDEEKEAAPVGVTQTTMEATPYQDPKNDNIVLYDVPGVATAEFPKSGYLDNPKVGIDKYTFIILISSTRFTEAETWLYNEMKKRKKTVFFVRTKVMIDVENEIRRKRENANKPKDTVIKDLIKKYNSEVKLDSKIYCIDSHDRDNPSLEFTELLNDIANEIPKNEREALLFTLRIYTPKLIDKKVEALRKRHWWICVLSAGAGAIPIPGISCLVDTPLIIKEGKFYRKQLGLEGRNLLRLAGTSAEKAVLLMSRWGTSAMVTLVTRLAAMEVTAKTAKYIFPFVGSLATGATSYSFTRIVLNGLLDEMAVDAKKLNELILENIKNHPDLH